MVDTRSKFTRRVSSFFRASLISFLAACDSNSPAATFLVLNTNDTGPGSFRQALLDANTTNGLDTIAFQIPGPGVHTISPLAALPAVSDPAAIDGATQPGYADQPLIELDGTRAGATPGLRLAAGGSTVRALIINRFSADGIRIEGPGTNVIRACYLGTDTTGSAARPNGQEGLWVYYSSGNLIGGTNADDRNVISGNADAGIYVFYGEGNLILGNFIGVSVSGTTAIPNANNGITLYQAPANRVGSAAPGAANLVSGNSGSGVYLHGPGATSNLIQGNLIGTTADGTSALSNSADGLTLMRAPGNLIGGTNTGEGNLISANAKAGIAITQAAGNVAQGNHIGTDVIGSRGLGNGLAGITLLSATNTLIGGPPGGRNLIAANRQDGIFLSTNSTGNRLQGNFLGTDITGTNALPNLYNGVSLQQACGNVIGGILPHSRNAIAGNANYGIQLSSGARDNVIEGNYVGADVTGNRALPNRLSGIRVESGPNMIGGDTTNAGNLLSGNLEDGLLLVGPACFSNRVQANRIGTTADGAGRLGNGRSGIGISDAARNRIGGSTLALGNLVSANAQAGIYLISPGALENEILGNRIGTDATGMAPLGNGLEGIYLENVISNRLGGSEPAVGNLISGNGTRGLLLTNSSQNLIAGNRIGTAADGVSPLGNTFHDVEFENGCANNMLGGSTGAGNVIAFAPPGYAGVRLRTGTTNNAILGNAIFGNGALGIDLGSAGITPNDACDTDTGANELQNFPLLLQAITGPTTSVRAVLSSAPNQWFRVQFYANPACDASANGEGQIFLGETVACTDGNCSTTFLTELPLTLPPGFVLTATATDEANNTSEFAPCIPIAPLPPLALSHAAGGFARIAWSNSMPGLALRETTSLLAPVLWTPVTNTPASDGGQSFVRIPIQTNDRFYRLSLQ
jgi:hypothetical protein